MNNYKKILCVSVMENWGGGELFLKNLVNEVKGFDFIIASPSGEVFNKLNNTNAKLIHVNGLKKIYRKSNAWLLKDKLKTPLKIKFVSYKLIRVIKKNKIDLILANGNFAALYSFLPAKLTKRKLIIVQHLLYNKNPLEAKVTSFIGKRATKLVCVSNAVALRTRAILNDNGNDKIIVIHNGIELPGMQDRIKNDNKINIGLVGSIIRAKGIDMVFESALPILKENKNVFLHIYGSQINDEDSLKYYEEIKSSLNSELKGNVKFHGYVDLKDEIYNSIDIVVNFSRVPEALPFNIMEAMAYGKIVIGADAGGTAEMIINKKNGFLVHKNDVYGLRKVLLYCIDNFKTEEMNNIRLNAIDQIKNNFSMQNFTKNYEQLFDSFFK